MARRGPGRRGGRSPAPPPLLALLLLLLVLGPAAAAGEEVAVSKECDKPCANGGRCQPGTGQCECQPGWVGDQCQHCGGRFRILSYFKIIFSSMLINEKFIQALWTGKKELGIQCILLDEEFKSFTDKLSNAPAKEEQLICRADCEKYFLDTLDNILGPGCGFAW
ncbi:hypothetical protein TURU_152553 [Turdus rufiventris]|nr:hypothetical protein TURU_152553 [Turdus rufiventris]